MAKEIKMNKNESNESDEETISAFCRKELGMDAQDVALLAEVPRRTFYDWWKSRNKAVRFMIAGIKSDLNQ